MEVYLGGIAVKRKQCLDKSAGLPPSLHLPHAKRLPILPANVMLSLRNVHLNLSSRAGDVHILRGVSMEAYAGRGHWHRRAFRLRQNLIADGHGGA